LFYGKGHLDGLGAFGKDGFPGVGRVRSASPGKLTALFDDAAPGIGGRIAAIYAILFGVNAGAWLSAGIAFHRYPVLLGTALLAYSLGLRHAVDADHIAAIDNVTRKLMQDGKRPVAVGFMFSLGHSTVVVFGSAVIAGAALLFEHRVDSLKNLAGLVGTSVSALFLFAIAIANLFVLRSIYQAFERVRRGEPYVEEDFNLLLGGRGLLSRLFRPMFRMISRSWHMYPLGFLFGLGFDTATEIGLLGISAAEAAKGLSFWAILVFPMLFAAGMSLIDTTDNVLMLGAYGWAFVKPIRKLYYNLTITCVSVVVALVVGGIEGLGLLAERFQLRGWFWGGVAKLNDNFDTLGYFVIGLFLLSWIVSIVFYKWRGFDDLELDA
jgi:nickel/cobalt transporter (NiCoT) family protein